MKITSVLVLFFTILVGNIYCLECYSCNNVTDVKHCTSSTTCVDAQSCYVEKSNVGHGITFEMGCLDNTKCGNRYPLGSLVGKRQVSHCHECCSTDHCNSNLCGYSREISCDDDPTVDCARLESLFSVCQDSTKAHELCPRFCGLCRNGSLPTMNPGQLTTEGSCQDMKSNCDIYDDAACTGIFESWARAHCAKRCNLCDRIATTTSGPPPMIGSTSGTSSRRPGLVIVSGSSYKIQGIKSPVSGTCFFNNQTFNLGDHWQDTCRYDCRCIETSSNTAQCQDVCPHYSSLPPSCTIRQKSGDCCPKLDCGNETDITYHPGPVNTTAIINASGCQDKIPGCEYYEDVVCRGIYEPWARDHCSLRCGYCGYSAPCVDNLTYCNAYELRTACRDFPGWARVNCKKSCGLCS
ncbi:uncharacterized protein LOC132734502 isoform X1 [Ruditapes philippinarum]|uniref:uncharacterized protein LOC132734502 isoform X1 n=1 Tax=Ruditapes philippinarum TaxID=129788 RepID=UPI00295B1E38|nr:uncharacterized protein LOC132734502 isoform X1 [Ruditapes philippinarum]